MFEFLSEWGRLGPACPPDCPSHPQGDRTWLMAMSRQILPMQRFHRTLEETRSSGVARSEAGPASPGTKSQSRSNNSRRSSSSRQGREASHRSTVCRSGSQGSVTIPRRCPRFRASLLPAKKYIEAHGGSTRAPCQRPGSSRRQRASPRSISESGCWHLPSNHRILPWLSR